jgi:hypothetical protein
MKTLGLLLAVVAAGCMDDSSHPPIQPGGAGDPGGTPTAGMITGSVCMADDLIVRASCSTTDVGGLTVALGDQSTTTAPDGTFMLPRPTGGGPLAFTVSGPGAVTTTTPYSPSTTIPVVNADVWAVTMASNNISVPEGTGSILGSLVRGGEPAAGVTVASAPAGIAGPFYDTDAGFGIDRTGARGVFLIPGVTAGTSTLSFLPGESTVSGISVVNGGVTILDSVILP